MQNLLDEDPVVFPTQFPHLIRLHDAELDKMLDTALYCPSSGLLLDISPDFVPNHAPSVSGSQAAREAAETVAYLYHTTAWGEMRLNALKCRFDDSPR